MKFNTPPFAENITNIKGKFHNSWQNFFSIMTNQLNQNLSDLGYTYPAISETTAQTRASQAKQQIVYNSDNSRMELNNVGQYSAIAVVATNTSAEIADLAIKPENLGRLFSNSDDNSLQFSLDGSTIRTIASTL